MSLNKLAVIYDRDIDDSQDAIFTEHFEGKTKNYRITCSNIRDNYVIHPSDNDYSYLYDSNKNIAYFFNDYHDLNISNIMNNNLFLECININYISNDTGLFTSISNCFFNVINEGIKIDSSFCNIISNTWNFVPKNIKKNIQLSKTSQYLEYFFKILQEKNFSYLKMEIEKLNKISITSMKRHSELLEEVFNISKLNTDNPFEKKIYEELQWDLIQIKKTIRNIEINENKSKEEKNLLKYIKIISNKLSDLDKIEKSFRKFNITEKKLFEESEIKTLSDGRIEIIWKKSG